MLYVKVHQSDVFPMIRIELTRSDNPVAGYIAARKSIDLETGQLALASVTPNISFYADFYTPDEAREIADLWRIAAKTAETLDLMIKSRSDLARPITARMTVKTVVLEWQD